MKIKIIKSSELTSECWMIQIDGLDACKNCEFLNTDECGGQNIRKRLLKENGLPE